MKPYRILTAVGAISLIGGTLFVASGPASAAIPAARTTPAATCGKTGVAGASSCEYKTPGTDTFTVATYDAMQTSGSPVAGAVLGKIVVLVMLILFIQRRPRGMFPLKGRAVEA